MSYNSPGIPLHNIKNCYNNPHLTFLSNSNVTIMNSPLTNNDHNNHPDTMLLNSFNYDPQSFVLPDLATLNIANYSPQPMVSHRLRNWPPAGLGVFPNNQLQNPPAFNQVHLERIDNLTEEVKQWKGSYRNLSNEFIKSKQDFESQISNLKEQLALTQGAKNPYQPRQLSFDTSSNTVGFDKSMNTNDNKEEYCHDFSIKLDQKNTLPLNHNEYHHSHTNSLGSISFSVDNNATKPMTLNDATESIPLVNSLSDVKTLETPNTSRDSIITTSGISSPSPSPSPSPSTSARLNHRTAFIGINSPIGMIIQYLTVKEMGPYALESGAVISGYKYAAEQQLYITTTPREPKSKSATKMPEFHMDRSITILSELLKEWFQPNLDKFGHCVSSMECQYRTKWRSKAGDKKYYLFRKAIINFILRELRRSPGSSDKSKVVEKLIDKIEKFRVDHKTGSKISFDKLSKIIRNNEGILIAACRKESNQQSYW
ncbi:hypothetical protein DASC09_024070 [Saccharomycopsis crataegensis]|uniref:Transcription activator GCR1-like domain-containing protein n=1 Tax=Saccharomycopsis crataegensis TaxID=43959 RepID=A0AAV5QJV7_9ASCO|nr:hypothetical protein DASC09_024070 [Saccharomycopsis crataegensis]